MVICGEMASERSKPANCESQGYFTGQCILRKEVAPLETAAANYSSISTYGGTRK
jgi:hypothetical protein